MKTMIQMCMKVWLIGLVGMLVAHTGFGQDPNDLICGVFTRMWGVGGASFLVLGAVNVLSGTGTQK